MRTKLLQIGVLIPLIGIATLLNGFTSSKPMNYSLFKKVPRAHLTRVEATIHKANIPHLKLPTDFPYPVTLANVLNGLPPRQVTIFFGDPHHIIEFDASQIAKNDKVTVMNSVAVKLPNGIHAQYVKVAAASELFWVEDAVSYDISSSNRKNKPDLTERQLVQVANSLR